MKFIVSLLFPTRRIFEEILNRTNSKAYFFIPIMLGLVVAITRTYNKYGQIVNAYVIGTMIIEIIKMIAIILIFSYLYSLIILFLSNMLRGLASFKLTLAILLYSLLPMIIGSLVILILNLIVFHGSNSWVLLIISIITQLWTIYILLMANSVINAFSYFKSFISSSIIMLIPIVFQLIQALKQ